MRSGAAAWGAMRRSLRLRLLLGTLASIVLAIAVAGWALSGLFHQHVMRQFQAELRLNLDTLVAHLGVDADGQPQVLGELGDPRFEQPYSGLYWQLERADAIPGGEVPRPLRSRSLWDVALRVDTPLPADGEVHPLRLPGPGGATLGGIAQIVGVDDDAGQTQRVRLLIAADERRIDEPVEHFSGMLWLFLGLLGLGLAAVAVLQVWVALVPLRRLQRALAAVRAGQAARLDGDFSGEVQPLVGEFNSVLAQNAEVVERARTQAGNLAHALKTPLSVIANVAQGLPGETGPLLSAQVEVARRQIDYHLRRARTAAVATRRVPGTRTPLGPVIDGLLRVMRRVHAARGLDFSMQGDADLEFRGETQDLQEILGNLLDNAGKWARSAVRLECRREDDQLWLTLDDDGPGIAEEARVRVLRRGERADEQVAGSGLGLSIVDDLVRLYAGRIALEASPLGGLRVRLALPAA